MPIAFKDFSQLLVSVQSKDKELDRLRSLLNNIPVQITEIENKISSEKQRLADLKQEQTQLQLNRKEREMSLSEKESLIRKHQQELNMVKSNEAFKGLLTEIERVKLEKDRLETEILEVLEQLDQAFLQEKERQRKFSELEQQLRLEIEKLKQEQARFEEELVKKTEERRQLTDHVPLELLERYEHIRDKKNGVAMAAVQGESCGGCHMSLTPHIIVDVRKQEQVVLCDSCQRILYLS